MTSDACDDCKKSQVESLRIASSFEMMAGEADSKALCTRCAKLRGMVFTDLYIKARGHKAIPLPPEKSIPGLRRLAEDDWIQSSIADGQRLTPEFLESLHEVSSGELLAMEAEILKEWASDASKERKK